MYLCFTVTDLGMPSRINAVTTMPSSNVPSAIPITAPVPKVAEL